MLILNLYEHKIWKRTFFSIDVVMTVCFMIFTMATNVELTPLLVILWCQGFCSTNVYFEWNVFYIFQVCKRQYSNMSQEKELDMVDRDPNGLNANVKVYTWSIGLFSIWCFLAFSGFQRTSPYYNSCVCWIYIQSTSMVIYMQLYCKLWIGNRVCVRFKFLETVMDNFTKEKFQNIDLERSK